MELEESFWGLKKPYCRLKEHNWELKKVYQELRESYWGLIEPLIEPQSHAEDSGSHILLETQFAILGTLEAIYIGLQLLDTDW